MHELSSFIPMDRRLALSCGVALPDRAHGAALLADLSDFTIVTEALATAYGPQRGAEELTHLLDQIFDALIADVHRYGGSVLGFSGDAITCWFDEALPGCSQSGAPRSASAGDDRASAPLRAATCALALQSAMAPFASVPLPGGAALPLALKCIVAAGPARRFLVGDPAIQQHDILAGPVLAHLGVLDSLAGRMEILLDAAAAAAVESAGTAGTWRSVPESDARALALAALAAPAQPAPWSPLPPDALSEAQVRPWVLSAVWDRLRYGQTEFLTELRPAVALFLRFTGIDYERPSAAARLDTYIRWVQAVLSRYEAALVQLTIGDKGAYLYASFGALTSHADDAARAVAAAQELRAPPASCGFIRGVQIGLAAGRARVGPYGGRGSRTYGVLGDSVNLAARLMQSAAPGGILATNKVRRAAGARFQWASLPALVVKGKSGRIPVWGLVSESPTRGLGLLEPAHHGPLIGRDGELRLLEARLAQAQTGRGQIVAVTGEAGLGKSRLVVEGVRRARQAGFLVYGGAAQSYGTNTAYLAWRSVWWAFFDLDPDGTPEEWALELEDRLAAIDPGLLERLPLLGPALGFSIPDTGLTAEMDPALRKASLEALLIDCLLARAAEAPILIVLEDCHWLDPLSHDLLAAIGRAAAQACALMLLAYRPPALERLRAPQVEALSHFSAIRLAVLPPEQIAALAAERLGGRAPAALVAQVVARVEGNPFFLEELLAYLIERGIDPGDPAVVAGIAWPDSLHSLLLARIDQLTESQRTVLKVASIIGRLFRQRQLWAVHPELGPREPVETDLAELDRLDLTPLDTPAPEPSYLFKHQVTQEVTYTSLPHVTRARLHEQFAAWLEAGSAAAGEPPPLDLLAYHYGQSPNLSKQREYYRKAGDAAAAAYANEAAIEYYERLLGLLAPGERREALVALGDVLERTAAWDTAAEHYLEALAEADAAGDLLGAAALGLGEARRRQGAYGEAVSWLERARALYLAARDTAGASCALTSMGWVYKEQGAYQRSRMLFSEGLELARAAGVGRGVIDALNGLGEVALAQGDLATARARYEEALALARQLDLQPGIAGTLIYMGELAWVQGDYELARGHFESALALARQLGDRRRIAVLLQRLGDVAGIQGNYVEAQAHYEAGLALTRQLGYLWSLMTYLINLGYLTAIQGEYAAAQIHYEEGLALARQMNVPAPIVTVLNNLGLVSVARQEYVAARAYYAEGLALARQLGEKKELVNGFVGLASLAIGEGLAARAARLGGIVVGQVAAIGGVLEPVEQRVLEQAKAAALAALGEAAFALEWASGMALPWEAALAEALGEAIAKHV